MRFFVLLLVSLFVIGGVFAQDATSEPTAGQVMFDDFNYTAPDDPALTENGWVVRAGDGWPGVPGAVWRAENVAFVADPDVEGNTLMQMTSSTNSDETYQTQVCHQRKYLEGTFATRVRFSDEPQTGPDGDNIVQTFYMISPQEFDMDPMYSELDFEYLPNGGWGEPRHIFHFTTWETFQLDPWIADNASDSVMDTFDGWHTLVLQIADGETHYFVDGEETASHSGKYYPEVPMSLNYNLWFIDGGQINSSEWREYVEQIDWIYASAGEVVAPEDVDQRVADLRAEEVSFTDTVTSPDPALETPCNF